MRENLLRLNFQRNFVVNEKKTLELKIKISKKNLIINSFLSLFKFLIVENEKTCFRCFRVESTKKIEL